MSGLLTALAFLTRLPVGRRAPDTKQVGHSAGWFPAIGILLGLIYGVAAALLRPHLSAAPVAVLLVALDAALTGALHFDGLADSADGFGGGKTREDVLRIMRDHCLGSYGSLALILLVGLKAIAYMILLEGEGWPRPIVLTPVLGRWSMLLLTATLPYARETASPIGGMGKLALLWGSLTMAAAVVAAGVWRGWIAAAAGLVVTIIFGFYCRRRIGGITGDTLGANLELCESVALLVFVWGRG